MHAIIEKIYRQEFRRIYATLLRLLNGDFDLAEDCLQEAFAAAVRQWPSEGVPDNPRAWLVTTARFKAIDRIRKQQRASQAQDELQWHADLAQDQDNDEEYIEDDRLRLIFTCCHPALAADVQIALTLREVCGLSTEMIAAAFLLQPTTLAQRLVRGKAKIRSAGIPYEIPGPQHMAERLDAVLRVIYLVFNEGYKSPNNSPATATDLSNEAIRLGRLLLHLLPEPEVHGLLALMLLHDARRAARTSADGELILLEDQDRALWNREQIAEGKALLEAALGSGRFGAYSLQAAIAALHAEAESTEATDWAQIVALYDLLLRLEESPVIALNRAVAIAMRDGPAAGLALIDELLKDKNLGSYYLAHAACADLQRRLGQNQAARAVYQQALALVGEGPERRFLEKRLQQLAS